MYNEIKKSIVPNYQRCGFYLAIACLITTACLGLTTAPAQAELAAQPSLYPDTPVGQELRWVVGLFNGEKRGTIKKHLAKDFLKQVTPVQILSVINQTLSTTFNNGTVYLQSVKEGATDNTLKAVLASKASEELILCSVGLEESTGKISALFLKPIAALITWPEFDKQLKLLPGKVSFAAGEIRPDDTSKFQVNVIHDVNPNLKLGIGSAFKLYVLGALGEKVIAGKTAYTNLLPIKEEFKSLPSGDMQNETAGTEFPVSHFADKMISISDNTATDHLIEHVGRTEVEAYMAQHQEKAKLSFPFLKTIEFFKLKLAIDETTRNQYIAATIDERRQMLQPEAVIGSAKVSLMSAAGWQTPVAIDKIEWFGSAIDMLNVMADLHRLETMEGGSALGHALRLNPGVPVNDSIWQSVGFKGGSERGVINLTFILERHDGKWFALSLGWNDTEKLVDEAEAVRLASAAIRILETTPQ